jgi:hypothetical protein
VLFFVTLAFKGHHSEIKYFNFALVLFAFVARACFEAFYFEITQDELIVKNYMLPFFNHPL